MRPKKGEEERGREGEEEKGAIKSAPKYSLTVGHLVLPGGGIDSGDVSQCGASSQYRHRPIMFRQGVHITQPAEQ